MPDFDGFCPAFWLPGPDLQTIVPSLLAGPPVPGPVERHVVSVAEGCAVRLDINRPAAPRATLLLVHGMGGSSESGYMRRTARQALWRGWVAARMNLRNCGGSESLTRGLYNAGQGDDVGRALRWLRASRGFPAPYHVAGFSLGGNIVLRYAGAGSDACLADAVVAVNPPVDLEACSRAIERPRNAIYRRHYVAGLRSQLRSIAVVRRPPEPWPIPRGITTVRAFDETYTAPDAGYRSVDEYYATASAGPLLERIRRPTLVLCATNDPFVPAAMFSPYHGLDAPLRFVHPSRGGHCGYWQSGKPRFWAGRAALDFLDASAASHTS